MRVENLHKSFGELEVLRGIDMEVDEGEVVVIFGRSGSGKSTLLRCINFLEDPTSGSVEVAGIKLEGGHRTKKKREEIRRLRTHCGMVFQQFNLFPHMTALGNVMEGPVTVKGMEEETRAASRDGGPQEGRPLGQGGASTRSACREASSSAWRSRGRSRWSPT